MASSAVLFVVEETWVRTDNLKWSSVSSSAVYVNGLTVGKCRGLSLYVNGLNAVTITNLYALRKIGNLPRLRSKSPSSPVVSFVDLLISSYFAMLFLSASSDMFCLTSHAT